MKVILLTAYQIKQLQGICLFREVTNIGIKEDGVLMVEYILNSKYHIKEIERHPNET